MIVAFTVFEIEKTKIFMKVEYISYTMTVDYKKKLKCNKMADFWKKKKNFAQKSDGFWPGKIIFSIQSLPLFELNLKLYGFFVDPRLPDRIGIDPG